MKLFLAAAFAVAVSAFGANAQTAGDPDTDFFDHNGSIIQAQYRYGNLRYLEVKPSMRNVVDRGMAIFSGEIERRGQAHGTAYVFKKGCDFVPYEVKGGYDPSIPGYVLKGAYPVREKKGCKVIGYSEKGANARLVFVDIFERDRRQASAKKAEEDAYAQQVYETEGGADWFEGFIDDEINARTKSK